MNRTVVLLVIIVVALGLLFYGLRPASQQTQPQERIFDLEIQGDTMTPDEIAVSEGDQVELRITADRPTEFHLHGYDLEEEIEPGEPFELSFEADITGRFEIEEERTQTELGTLVVEPRQEG